MGERKVLNRYIPPDFDPSIIPKFKRKPDKLSEIRMMIPFSLCCNHCNEYMYKGKKFNSRKEEMYGDTYMGIKKWRFYIKCCVCSNEITFCTNPKNADYDLESGASRNFEIWKDNDQKIEEEKAERTEDVKLDAMKALENRTMDSKIEMDVLDALDEIKAINQRHERINTNKLLNSLIDKNNKNEEISKKIIEIKELEDEEIVKNIKFGVNTYDPKDNIEVKIMNKLKEEKISSYTSSNTNMNPIIIKKKRKIEVDKTNDNKSKKKDETPIAINALSGLINGYDSD